MYTTTIGGPWFTALLYFLSIQVDFGSLSEPLCDESTVPYPYPDNRTFVHEFTIRIPGSSFPNMTTAEVTQFVQRAI